MATLGTATTPTHVQKLFRLTDSVVFCFDGDAAGRKAAWRALETALPFLADDKTAQAFADSLKLAGTIVWNGPVGVFEFDAFARGTETLARAIAESPAFSIAGGGDTIAAIHKFGIAQRIGYISTAGGAFLEFLEGKTLPAVAVLEDRA